MKVLRAMPSLDLEATPALCDAAMSVVYTALTSVERPAAGDPRTYAVLLQQTAGGPKGSEIFDLRNVAIETGCLLMSSFTCGMASIAADERNKFWFQVSMAVTCALGLAFLYIEFREFADLVARGAGPSRSAFLSAFFTLVGCHGLHVSAGVLWLLTMMAQVFAKGFRADIQRRILCFALFWHALDIIWVAVFSVVYLLGSAA